MYKYFFLHFLFFAPHHLIHYGDVALYDFDYDVRNIFTNVDIDGSAVVVVGVHCYGSVDGLQKRFFIDARKDEPCVVEALGALCRRCGCEIAGKGWPTEVKKLDSSGSVPESEITAAAFI